MTLTHSMQSRLKYQHQTIDELINGVSEEHLKVPPPNNKWSAFENIVHLTTYQPVFLERIDKVLSGTGPRFERYVADHDSFFVASCLKSLPEVMKDLYQVRDQIYITITELSATQLAYTGYHPKYGELHLVEWIEFFLLHESHHLFTLFMLINNAAGSLQ